MKKIGLIILIIICSTSYIYGFPLENNDSILLEKDTLQLGIAPLSDNSLINTEGYIPSVIRPSPQSQLFDKYINHKVTEYNGLPEISIPLYEIEMKGLKIPISLTYHASGIQFRQSDGDVGTGWSINAGGYRVSRTIYGLPDEDAELYDTYEYLEELRNSYSNPFTLHFDDYLSSIDRNFINPFSNLDVFKAPAKDQDGAYDIFTYSLPSGGGHFLITDRETKEIIILEGNVERINFNKSNFKEIQIVDGNGFTYHLGGQYSGFEYNEYCKRIPQIIEKPTASSWLLRQIKSPYSEFLEFNYSHYHIQRDPEHDDPTSHVFFSSLVAQDAGISYDLWHCPSFLDSPAQPYFPNQLWLTDRNIHESFLNEIKNDEVTVRFVRSYNTNNDRLVKEIQVLNHQKQIIKRIEFQYNYVEPHSLLSSITIKGDSDIEMQKYDFDYYNPPYLNSYADQWGYYLFTERNTGPKGFSITLHEEFKKEHLLQSCFNGNLLSLNSPHILYTNERKNYGDFWFPKNSNDAPHYYSLKSIKFPTGGQTIYEYEPNKFQERNINNTDVYTGNGQRIKRIISKTSMNDNDIPIVTNFKYGKGESGIGICDIALKSEHFSTQSLVLYTASEPASIGEPLSFFALKSSRTYNERAVAPDVLFPKVNYEQVTSYSYNDLSTTAQPNGKIISIYSIPYVYTFNTLNSMTGYEDPWHGIASPYNELSKIFNHKFYRDRQHGIPSRILGRSPYLQSKEIYSVDNKLMKKTDYKYKQLYTSSVYFNLNTVQTLHHEGQDARTVCAFNYSFAHGEYTIIGARDLLMQAKTIDYFDKNDSIVSSELYEYDDKHRLIKAIKTNSLSVNELIKENIYPTVENSLLVQKNIISTPIETIMTNNGNEIERVKHIYSDNSILPTSLQVSYREGADTDEFVSFDRYDSKGNLIEYRKSDNIPIIYLYSYNGQHPIAEIKNAIYTDVEAVVKSVFNVSSIDYLSSLSSVTLTQLKKLREHSLLQNALITTYTYAPLVGITSMTDPSGKTTYYDYDDFGRLKRTYIKEKNIITGVEEEKTIEEYDYHYKQ